MKIVLLRIIPMSPPSSEHTQIWDCEYFFRTAFLLIMLKGEDILQVSGSRTGCERCLSPNYNFHYNTHTHTHTHTYIYIYIYIRFSTRDLFFTNTVGIFTRLYSYGLDVSAYFLLNLELTFFFFFRNFSLSLSLSLSLYIYIYIYIYISY